MIGHAITLIMPSLRPRQDMRNWAIKLKKGPQPMDVPGESFSMTVPGR